MFNILLILIFVGGIVIAAVFAGITFLQGVRSAQEVQITKQRMVETAARIQSQARYISGYIALPKGANGAAPYVYNQVPTWISSYARNAAGVPFAYCPYRSTANGGTADTVTLPSGGTYNINYTSNATTISQSYVTAGDAPPAAAPTGTIGLLIAASPQSNQPPDCSNITASSDGTPVVNGGYVVAIQDNFLNKGKVETTPSELRIYISGSASGDGTGRDTNNYATVTTAMNMLNYARPAQATLVFAAGGPYSFGSVTLWGGRILLQGVAAGSTTITVSSLTVDEFSHVAVRNALLSDSGTLTVRGELELDSANVTTTTLLSIQGGKVTSIGSNTITGNITVDGGGTLANSVSSTMAIASVGNRGLKITNGLFVSDGGTVNVNPSAASIVPAYVGAGGNIQTAGLISLNPAATSTVTGGMVIDPGGRVGVVQVGGYFVASRYNDYAIYAHGNLDLTVAGYVRTLVATSASLTYGVVLASGGTLLHSQSDSVTIIGSTAFATRPATAIYDNGGHSFFMNSTTSISTVQARTACWSGRAGTTLFSDSPAGTNGNVSYTNNSATYKWLRLYNQSYASCSI